MLKRNDTVLLVIDVQGNLAHLMDNRKDLFENLQKIIKGTQIFGIPSLWIEQNPQGLGATITEIAEILADSPKIEKLSFSCLKTPAFETALKQTGRRQVLVSGIEAHICVYQTSLDLIEAGYEVYVVSDAVSSRKRENKTLALENLRAAGAKISSVEMALFEILQKAEGELFKKLVALLR